MSGLKKERVLDAVGAVLAQREANCRLAPVEDYRGGMVSAKVLRIVLSYSDYVKRTVWSEV